MKKSNWFEWQENLAGNFIRRCLTRCEAEEAFDFYKEPFQYRYHVRSNEWDFADDFDPRPKEHNSALPKMFDLEDHNDEFFDIAQPSVTINPPRQDD